MGFWKKKKKNHRAGKEIILAEVFCSCDDLRTENVILINWHDQPELLLGQVESGACRKQSSHVAGEGDGWLRRAGALGMEQMTTETQMCVISRVQ